MSSFANSFFRASLLLAKKIRLLKLSLQQSWLSKLLSKLMTIIAPFKVFACDKTGFFKESIKDFSKEQYQKEIYFSRTVHSSEAFYNLEE